VANYPSYTFLSNGVLWAIRTASSLISGSTTNGRADVVHTELLSAHLNLTEFSIANTMICSLLQMVLSGILCTKKILS
jgi:hypothetical protein